LWYAAKIKADSSSRVVTTSPATDVTTATASLHGTYDYPSDVTQRGFQYGLTTGYGSTVVDGTSPVAYTGSGSLDDVVTSGSNGYATDSDGNLYVTYFNETLSAAVRKYSPSGALLAEYGSQGTGNGQLNQPMDLTLDTSGNIYIADSQNKRVQKLDSAGAYVSQFSPLEQGSGISIYVTSLAVDSLSNVLIYGYWDADPGTLSDWQPVVQKYNSAGVLQVQMINSSGTATNQLYNWGQWPDLAVDVGNNLYITDTYNHRVLKYDSSGVFATQWGTTGVAGTVPGQFDRPYGITIGPDGNIYIVDSGNDRVQVLDTAGNYIQSWSGNPNSLHVAVSSTGKMFLRLSGGVITGVPSIDASISSLQCDTTYHYRAFATDADSTEYGSDATFTTDACTGLRNIAALPADSISQTGATLHGITDYPQGITGRGFQYGLTTSYGSGAVDSSAVNLSLVVTSQGLGGPVPQNMVNANDVVTDSSGATYVADSGNSRIRKYSSAGAWIANWPVAATGLAIDANNVIFATTASSVQKLDSNGNLLLEWGAAGSGNGEFNSAAGLDVSVDGFVYVADYGNSRIQKFNSAGDFIAKWGTYGQGDNEFGYPGDVAVDRNGNVYVGDYYDSPIPQSFVKKYNSAGVFITEWGGNVSTADGKFTQIRGLAVDAASESIYVADRSADPYGRIQQFSYGGTLVRVVASGDYFNGVAITPGGAVIAVTNNNSSILAYSTPIDATISSLTCGTTYHYRPYVTDRGGTQYGSDATFTTSACPPLNITTPSLDDGVVGVSYSDYITADNLQGGETYSISSGSLPPGLGINASTGYITGTPSQAGTFNFDVTVENAGSSDTAFLSITIAEFANPLSITTASLPDAQVSTYYQEYIYTSDSVSDVTFSVVSGALPDGMTLYGDASSGILYGTPTSPGTYTFTVQAQDSRGVGAGTDTQQYSITVSNPNINITTTSLPAGRVGVSYDRTIAYTDASATPVFSLASGTLPPGVSLTLQGYLQGTPTQEGTFNFTVQADDGFSSDTQALSMFVNPAIVTDNTPFVTITSPATNTTFPDGASTITGTGPANKTIQVFIDGVQVGTTTASAQGTWTYQVSGIAAGIHVLEAKWAPGSDVAFVPFATQDGLAGIRVVDNATTNVIRTLKQPDGLLIFGTNLNRAGTKLYIHGRSQYTQQAELWEIDINTMVARSLNLGSTAATTGILRMTITGNDATGVLSGVTFDNQGNVSDLWLQKVNLITFSLSTKTPNLPGSYRNGVISRSVMNADSTKLYTGHGAVAGSLLEYTVSNRSVRAIDIPGTDSVDNVTYEAGKLYVLTRGSDLILHVLDEQSDTVLKSISLITGIGAVNTQATIDVDPNTNIGYVSVPTAPDGQLLTVNLQTDVVVPVISSPINTLDSGLSTDGLRLYIPNLSGGLRIWDTQTSAFVSGTADFMPANTITYSLGTFLGPIAPPKGAILFGVAGATPPPPPPPPVDCSSAEAAAASAGGSKSNGTASSGSSQPKTNGTATNLCTVVPPPVAEPPAPVSTPATVGTPSSEYPKVVTTPSPAVAPTIVRRGWFDRGVLAVAHFVPRQAAIGFPYVLFLLLLLFALSLYYQSTNEVRKDKLNRQFLIKRKSIRAQQDNFIALASHYLNTPITIIQNGIEVMEESEKGSKSK